MRICLFALALVLVGCATPPRPPVLPEVVTPTVTTSQVVVTAPCVGRLPDSPAWATETLPANADEFQRAKALLIERQQRRAYVPTLEAMLKACQ